MTTFADGLYQFGGIPVGNGSIPTTQGNVYFVNAATGNDSISGGNGSSPTSPLQTLAYAYSVAKDGNDDVICVMGGTAQTLGATLYVTKSRLHFLGLDGAAKVVGQGAVITIAATSGSTNIAAIVNTGTNNSFVNLNISSTSTVTQGIYAFVEGGTGTYFSNCRFIQTGQYPTGAADFVANGTRTNVFNCSFGSLTTAVTAGTAVAAAVLFTANIAAVSINATDNIFEDCYFFRNASDTSNRFVYAANATDIVGGAVFKRCGFINAANSSATPAQAIASGASLTSGYIMLDPECFAVKVTKISTSTGVLVSGPAPSSGTGIAVNAA